MPGEYIATYAEKASLDTLIKGEYLKGHRLPRIAMVGRSNVGKSTLINALLGRTLARVSKQPGKTREIHFYLAPEYKKIVADLPGYGFAKSSHADRDRWGGFINAYLKEDPGLERALVLMDSRHGPTALDLEALRFLQFESIPVTFVMSKSDLIRTQKERAARKKEVESVLSELGFDPWSLFWISSKTKDGLKDLMTELKGERK